MRERKQRRLSGGQRLFLLTAVVMVVSLAALTAISGRFFLGAPGSSGSRLDYPNQISMGEHALAVVDRNLTRISCLKDGTLAWQLKGGKRSEKAFYMAQNAMLGSQDRLYVNNIVYEEMGSEICTEQLLCYTSDGRFDGVVYEKDYEGQERPRQAGMITGMTSMDGSLFWVLKEKDRIRSFRYDEETGLTDSEEYAYQEASDMILDAVFPEAGRLVILRKDGIIHELGGAGEDPVFGRILYRVPPLTEAVGSVPYRLALNREGKVCFSDIGTRYIAVLDGADGEPKPYIGAPGQTAEEILEKPLYIRIAGSASGFAASDGETVTIWDGASKPVRQLDRLPYGMGTRCLLTLFWAAALLAAGMCLWKIFRLVRARIAAGISSRTGTGLLITAAIVTAALCVALIVIPGSRKMLVEEYVKSLVYTGNIMTENVDFDPLKEINELEDIHSEAYHTMTKELDTYIRSSYGAGGNLYYMVYKIRDQIPFSVLDSENMYPVIYPQLVTDNWYRAQGGAAGTLSDYQDSEGVWAFHQMPVYDHEHEIIGVIEIGLNMYALDEGYRRQILEILSAMLTLIVLMFLFTNEGMAFSGLLKAKRDGAAGELPPKLIRTLMFLIYFAQCTQDAFIPILTMQMYEPLFGLPPSVGAAIPISLEMLMVALFSVAGGRLLERFSIRNVIFGALAVAGTGFAVSASSFSFLMLTLGKGLIGAGVGLAYVSGNTCCCALPEKERNEAFASLNAGMLSGIQVGCVLGAMVLKPLTFRGVYLISLALTAAAAAYTLIFIKKGQFQAERENSEVQNAEGRISTVRFLTDPRIILFLLLAVVPALLAVTYLEYYIPIFSYDMGLSEAQIGQILLLQGALVIYTGPLTTRYLAEKLNTTMSVALAGFLYAAALAGLAWIPSIPTLLVFVTAYGVISGFMYSAHSIHYSTIPALEQYGISRGMGLYSMFQNTTQSFGPMLLGAAMMTGFRAGTAAVAAGIGGLAAVFLVVGTVCFGKKRGANR